MKNISENTQNKIANRKGTHYCEIKTAVMLSAYVSVVEVTVLCSD